MAKTVKRKAPSRARYEQAHPTVSCRVPKEVYDRLQVVRNEENKSFADVLKIGLGILEGQAKKEGAVRKRTRDMGYKDGFAFAQQLHKVTYPCSVCGKLLTVTSGDEKEAIKKYMQDHGWGHRACHEKKQ